VSTENDAGPEGKQPGADHPSDPPPTRPHARQDQHHECNPADSPDAWIDRDGRIYVDDGPYLNRWTRRVHRYLTRWTRWTR
jgi:hypothetical protein